MAGPDWTIWGSCMRIILWVSGTIFVYSWSRCLVHDSPQCPGLDCLTWRAADSGRATPYTLSLHVEISHYNQHLSPAVQSAVMQWSPLHKMTHNHLSLWQLIICSAVPATSDQCVQSPVDDIYKAIFWNRSNHFESQPAACCFHPVSGLLSNSAVLRRPALQTCLHSKPHTFFTVSISNQFGLSHDRDSEGLLIADTADRERRVWRLSRISSHDVIIIIWK